MGISFILLVSILALSVIFYQLRTGVPPFPATAQERKAVVHLLKQVPLPPGAQIYELGSGWGGMALDLARSFPEAQVIGLEVSWLPHYFARLRGKRVKNVEFLRQNFHSVSLKEADAIATYLMIKPMEPLAQKFDRELKKGTPVVSLAFFFREREPTWTVEGKGIFQAAAALYKWPALGHSNTKR